MLSISSSPVTFSAKRNDTVVTSVRSTWSTLRQWMWKAPREILTVFIADFVKLATPRTNGNGISVNFDTRISRE